MTCSKCGRVGRLDTCDVCLTKIEADRKSDAAGENCASSTGSLPRGPWIASSQYGMHMVLSQDNEIILRADNVPFETLRAMVTAANEQLAGNGAICREGGQKNEK